MAFAVVRSTTLRPAALVSAAMAVAVAGHALALRLGAGPAPAFTGPAWGSQRVPSGPSSRVGDRTAAPGYAVAAARSCAGVAGSAVGPAPWAALLGGGLVGAAAACCSGARRGPGRSRCAVALQAEGQSEVSLIDFRVGEVLSCERHPDSEKLLVEMIDVGEDAPRQICSGIAPWFAPEDVTGRRVVIVANLKARKLAGIPSNGMLLCASAPAEESEDGGKGALAIVEAPAGAANGERIVVEVEGEELGEAAAPNRVQKKKLYEKVAPHLCTDGEGKVCFKESPFMTTAGPCTAPSITKGVVS